MMVLDTALAHGVMLTNGIKQKLKYLKPFTRRFVFNADASHKQGRFAMEAADTICRNANYIVKPYPNTYIEIDNHACIRGAKNDVMFGADERIGYLWTEYGQCFVCYGSGHKAEWSPFVYAQHGTGGDGDRLWEIYDKQIVQLDDSMDDERMTYARFKQYLMIGQVAPDLRPDVNKFSHNLTDLYEIGLARSDIPMEVLEAAFNENIGTYKYALACLMLLDERIKRQLVHVPATRKVIQGKLTAVAKHDVVTIDLDVPTIRKVYAKTAHQGGHQIEHDVSEHWVYYDCSTQCQHDWQPFTSEEATERDLKYGHKEPLRREVCSDCGGRRTRKPSYVAGDPKKGSTVGKKRYRVIASQEKNVINVDFKKRKG
jgi:hypothetical protein